MFTLIFGSIVNILSFYFLSLDVVNLKLILALSQRNLVSTNLVMSATRNFAPSNLTMSAQQNFASTNLSMYGPLFVRIYNSNTAWIFDISDTGMLAAHRPRINILVFKQTLHLLIYAIFRAISTVTLNTIWKKESYM
jgi:hypothetical protein